MLCLLLKHEFPGRHSTGDLSKGKLVHMAVKEIGRFQLQSGGPVDATQKRIHFWSCSWHRRLIIDFYDSHVTMDLFCLAICVLTNLIRECFL